MISGKLTRKLNIKQYAFTSNAPNFGGFSIIAKKSGTGVLCISATGNLSTALNSWTDYTVGTLAGWDCGQQEIPLIGATDSSVLLLTITSDGIAKVRAHKNVTVTQWFYAKSASY